jgi:hypothetical protein
LPPVAGRDAQLHNPSKVVTLPPVHAPHHLIGCAPHLRQFHENFLRTKMVDLLVHNLLIAIEREVISLRGYTGFRYAEALRRP